MKKFLILFSAIAFVIASCTVTSCTSASEEALTATTVEPVGDSLPAATPGLHNQFEQLTTQGEMMQYLTANAHTLTVVSQSDSTNPESVSFYTVEFRGDTNLYYVRSYDQTGYVAISDTPPGDWVNMPNRVTPNNSTTAVSSN